MAHGDLGLASWPAADRRRGNRAYRKALEMKPDYVGCPQQPGHEALADSGRLDEAIAQYRKALEIKPDYAGPTTTSAYALARRGQVDEAIAHYRKALEIRPDYATAHNDLGLALGRPRTGRRGHRPLPQGPGNQARLRRGPRQSWATSWPVADESTRPSPISERPWKSGPTTPRPTTTWETPWRARTGGRGHRPFPQGPGNQARLCGCPQQLCARLGRGAESSTRPSPISARPWKSSPTLIWPTSTSVQCWPTAERWTRPWPTTRRPWNLPRQKTSRPWPTRLGPNQGPTSRSPLPGSAPERPIRPCRSARRWLGTARRAGPPG